MTNEELIAKFNPANAATLTAEDLLIMRNLTDDQIGVLAEAYPNQPMRKAYLRLYDTRLAENKQLFQTSTWQNLRNVRKFSNFKHLQPYDFIIIGKGGTPAKVVNMQGKGNNKTTPVKKVVDLSATEAANELKAAVTTANVDNTKKQDKKVPPAKPTKPAAGAKKPEKKATEEVISDSVENDSIPEDEQFSAGD